MKTLRQWFGLGLLALVFVASLGVSIRNTLSIERPRGIVLRIAHWQLERGYRQALQAVIEDYQALHPGVTIEQVATPDRLFTQSINTQLISNTAPDLCEMGSSDLITKDDNTVRYFLPLSGFIVQPNPYNRGTDLENALWKDTLLDGMRGGFREGLAEYYSVPTTTISMRLYYNKQLLRAATGSDQPPQTFGQWIAMCEQVRRYGQTQPGQVLPIISCYDLATMQPKYEATMTASFERDIDADWNGEITPLETYMAYRQGRVSLTTPAMKAAFELMRQVGAQMQQGFSAMDRQQAQFRFVNGQAAFMWSGSWDASGTQAQAAARGFEIGIMRLPLPGPGEPFAEFVNGPAAEGMDAGGKYGVIKSSPHTDLAIDFLRYLTSRTVNEKFNRLAEWPPMTIGAKPSDLMAPFAVDRRGYSSRLQFGFGTRAAQDLAAQTLNYLQGDLSFDALATAYDRIIQNPYRGGDWAWWKEFDDRRSDVRGKERVLAQQQTLELIVPSSGNPERYRRALLQQVIRNNAMDYPYQFQQQRGQPMPEF